MRYKKIVFISLTGILFLAFGIPVYKKYTSSQILPENAVVPNSQTETPDAFPVFDKDNPQAEGVILAFKHWPLSQEETELVFKELTERGLKKKSESSRSKMLIFKWPDWRKGLEAKKVCEAVSKISFLEYCEPNYLLGPMNDLSQTLSPKSTPPNDNEQPVSKGNLRACNIISAKFELKRRCGIRRSRGGCKGEPTLSDYWSQEMIGADLLREELEKAPTLYKKYFVSVFDTPKQGRHDLKVKNLISDEGLQAVLPELKEKISISYVRTVDAYRDLKDRLLDEVEKQCGFKKQGESPIDVNSREK